VSKASEFAKRKPRDLQLNQIGSPYSELFCCDEHGRLLIGDAGPFTRKDALKLARWILDTFGEEK